MPKVQVSPAAGGPAEAQAGLDAHRGLLGHGGGGMRAVMVGAHASFTVGDDTMRAVGDLAREAGVGVHIHMAEAVDDEQSVGEPLVARMRRLGALAPGSLLAHCIHLQPDELAMIADAGAWVSHQPRSNMNNHVGYAPVAHFGENTFLGTDGIGADMLAELQTGYFQSREAQIPWWPDRFLRTFAAAARFSGDKLGVTLGRLEVGAAADLLVLDPIPGPPLTDANLPGAFIFRFASHMVRHTMVAGSWRLWDRQVQGVDVLELDAWARRVAPQVWARMA